jgi:hypothetical protein
MRHAEDRDLQAVAGGNNRVVWKSDRRQETADSVGADKARGMSKVGADDRMHGDRAVETEKEGLEISFGREFGRDVADVDGPGELAEGRRWDWGKVK